MSTAATVTRHPNQFATVSSFFSAVKLSGESRGARVDPRLYAAAPSTVSTENIGSDGGYAVPPDMQKRLTDSLLGETDLLSRCTLIETTKNAIGLPLDPNPSYSISGPQAGIGTEASSLNQSKLGLALRSVRLAKLSVLLPLSDELIEDGGLELAVSIADIVAQKLRFEVNSLLLSGTGGAGEPIGWLNSPALITVAAESGPQSQTVVEANVRKMMSRLVPEDRASAVWVVHSSVEEQLRGMVSPVGAPALVYSGAEPFARLYGFPVLVSEACSALGVVGDISLVAMKGIVAAVRPGLVKRQLSTDVWFDQGIGAFRFTMRLGASPLLNAAVSQKNGGSTVSSCVTLAARP
jgi:HK97 family phage major capsid protein